MAGMNLALAYLAHSGETLGDYDGFCMELVDQVQQWKGLERGTLWIEDSEGGVLTPPARQTRWKYHAVLVVDGLVHDAWHPEVLPVAEYLEQVFPNHPRLSVELDGERIKADPRQLGLGL